ncbi:hypothetical protein [Plasmodium yoelii yoelii]|uniref:Uncharacterized protein n=1 Tax=Plasmodium yoelii yoelii TaxID=73239 RepID=Q7RF11_PLAYO|nr:hypothetical protein [Plasmodium yoelii yoelii]
MEKNKVKDNAFKEKNESIIPRKNEQIVPSHCYRNSSRHSITIILYTMTLIKKISVRKQEI